MNKILELTDYVTQQGELGRQRKIENQDRAESDEEKQLKKLRGAAKYMKQAISTKNPAAINGAWQAVRPYLAQTAGGQMPPEQWSPELEQKMEQAIAQTEYLDKEMGGNSGKAAHVSKVWTDSKGDVYVTMSDNPTPVPTGKKGQPNQRLFETDQGYSTFNTKSETPTGVPLRYGGEAPPAPSQAPPPDAPPMPTQTSEPQVSGGIAAQVETFRQNLKEAGVDDVLANQMSETFAQKLMTQTSEQGVAIDPQANVIAPPAGAAPTPITAAPAAPMAAPTPAAGPIPGAIAQPAPKAGNDAMVNMTPDEVAAAGLPVGTFAQRNLVTNEIKVGPAAAQPKSKELGARELKLKFEAEDALNVADSLDMTLGDIITKIDSGDLELGPVENLVSAGRNYIGKSNPNSVNYATFKSSLEKLRNDVLILNKGVQTEGDAKRAMNAILASPNDPKVVKAQMERLRILNDRARMLQQRKIDSLGSGSSAPTQNNSGGGWSVQEIK